MQTEVCANSYQSAINAQKGGADRIELCTELGVGGITPSYGLLKRVLAALSIPVNVLIRPRSGDFCYSKAEYDTIKADIEFCKSLGCAGIVCGVLLPDLRLDVERTKELIELSRPMKFTFHRAFDCVKDPLKTLKQLIDLGADTVLTSGQEKTAIKGIDLLNKMKARANGGIRILPGGGINENNVRVFKDAGFGEVHFSATVAIDNLTSLPFFDDQTVLVSDLERIKKMVGLVKSRES